MIVDMEKIKEMIDQIEDPHIKAILEIDYNAASWSDANMCELIRRFNDIYNQHPELFL
ncbi:MAG: hypothetical protein PHE67_00285 [Campylobacterales bacterium]|nr:hypothetical protein [Campylobacterales bacterium]